MALNVIIFIVIVAVNRSLLLLLQLLLLLIKSYVSVFLFIVKVLPLEDFLLVDLTRLAFRGSLVVL